jgi:hypothetical protein
MAIRRLSSIWGIVLSMSARLGTISGVFRCSSRRHRLLRIWITLTAISALSLIAASCAQMATASAAASAAQAATVESTQAYEALENAANAATEISGVTISTTNPSAPNMPGFTLIETPDSYILVKNGQMIVLRKNEIYGYTGSHENH